jgi:hypothetical protein
MDTAPSSEPRGASLRIVLLLVLLICAAVLRSALGTARDSYTIDEPWHTVAGVAYARHGDFALNPEHPPLVKRWVAAFMPAAFEVPPTPPLREKSSEREYVEQVMYGDNDYLAAQSRTRLAMWIFHGLVLGLFALLLWRAFGPAWAAGALAFLAIDPSVAANLPLVMTDLPVALGLALAALCLGRLLSRWEWPWAFALGAALALAFGAKHSALTGLAGLALFAWLAWAWQARHVRWRERARRAAQLVLAGLLALGLVWAQYDFRFHARPDGSDGFNRDIAAKIDDLRTPTMKRPIALADEWKLLPRAYLWGLADTVRAGVEGRGQPGSIYWGRFVPGEAPWYAWPSLVVIKLPLALIAMILLGAFTLWRMRGSLSPAARWSLCALLAMGLAHGLSLVTARTAYAGIRHALPLVIVGAILAGAWLAYAWRRGRAWRIAGLLPLGIALLMSAREPRLWEYHNELVGGSENAWRLFDNEGVDIGQRMHEVVAFGAREIAPRGETLYLDHFNSLPFNARAPFPMRRRVESIHDDNVEGIYEGWFMKAITARLPAPHFGYDPAEGLHGLEPVARFGYIEIWRGRQERPKSRASGLFFRVMDYVYAEGGNDWALVARRAQEIIDQFPQHAPAAIELGNAHLRLGDRAAARKAYADVLAQTLLPVEPLTREGLLAQIARIDAAGPDEPIEPMRNAAME